MRQSRVTERKCGDPAGNLTQRVDLKQNVTETFYYDALNRFDYSQRNGTTNADVTLDAIGNISWKQGIGSYTYHATKRRAVISAGGNSYGYDADGNMTTRNGSSISYTSYDLPSMINAGSNSSTLYYGANRNRYKQVAITAGANETTIYVGGILEKVTRGSLTEYRHLIAGGKGIAAIYTRPSTGSPATYYVHSDHLGSPELITNSAGAPARWLHGDHQGSVIAFATAPTGSLLAINAYDEYGKQGSANTGRFQYTGQAAIPQIGLYYYKARFYNPALGRFMQTDPIGYEDDFNLYAYVGNDPLDHTDPSGNCVEDACVVEGTLAVEGMIYVGAAIAATPVVTKIADAIGDAISNVMESRSKAPGPLPEAEGRPHSIPDANGGYTTHGPRDPVTGKPESEKQFRPTGKPHGDVPRPNVKDRPANTRPDGAKVPGKPEVRPPTPDEVRNPSPPPPPPPPKDPPTG